MKRKPKIERSTKYLAAADVLSPGLVSRAQTALGGKSTVVSFNGEQNSRATERRLPRKLSAQIRAILDEDDIELRVLRFAGARASAKVFDREIAVQLVRDGHNMRTIAIVLDVTYQSIGNWTRRLAPALYNVNTVGLAFLLERYEIEEDATADETIEALADALNVSERRCITMTHEIARILGAIDGY